MFNANPDKYKIWSNYQPSAEKIVSHRHTECKNDQWWITIIIVNVIN